MKFFKIFTIILFLIIGQICFAQSNDAKQIQSDQSKLEAAINANDEQKQAEAYISIAENYSAQNQFAKSEEFLQKAKTIYEKNGNKNALASVIRKIAQVQESQNKTKFAAENYEKAAKYSVSKKQKATNQNDYSRVSANSNSIKERAIQENIELNKTDNSDELAKDYTNLAEVNIQQNKIPQAAENYDKAYNIAKNTQPEQALIINQKMTDLYVENKEYSKAIETKKKVLDEAFIKEDSQEKVSQIQELADIYLQSDNREEAIKLYQNAYELALSKNHTLEARKSLLKLDSLYNSNGLQKKSIDLYQNFLSKLPSLLQADQSLVDSKIIKETEERIAQLEKEKSLNEQLMKRKNRFNYLLIAGLVLAVGFIAFALYIQKKLRIQNKKIELQSLRREMNPHFIFNSLNSVNQFIAQNNELEANAYLTKFSKLMRSVMENSKDDFIFLKDELSLLQNYLALEKSRFQDKFDYQIKVEESLLDTTLQIPGMLIQPFLENAIWHGLRYKEVKGFLNLELLKSDKKLYINIQDNGIGIAKSKAQKTQHQNHKNGRGMKNTDERIRLLNDLYKKNIQKKITTTENGVLVELSLNLD